MTLRFDFPAAAPHAFAAALALDRFVADEAGIEPRLLHLVKIRASQINGCAYCLDMHVTAARRDGFGGQWLDLIAAWRGARVHDARERAALAWTEALTRLPEAGPADADYLALRAQAAPQEIAALTLAVGAINLWNRLVIASRPQHPLHAGAAPG